jgi:hypothetical protein
VLLSLHFVAFSFFFKVIILTSMKSLGYSPVSCMLFIGCVISFRPSGRYVKQMLNNSRKSLASLPDCTGLLTKVFRLLLRGWKRENARRERRNLQVTHFCEDVSIQFTERSGVICTSDKPLSIQGNSSMAVCV